MTSEIRKPYLINSPLYDRVLKVASNLRDKGHQIELKYYLWTVDVAKAMFSSTGIPLSDRRVKTLLTSTNTLDFNQRLNRFPKKLFGL